MKCVLSAELHLGVDNTKGLSFLLLFYKNIEALKYSRGNTAEYILTSTFHHQFLSLWRLCRDIIATP